MLVKLMMFMNDFVNGHTANTVKVLVSHFDINYICLYVFLAQFRSFVRTSGTFVLSARTTNCTFRLVCISLEVAFVGPERVPPEDLCDAAE